MNQKWHEPVPLYQARQALQRNVEAFKPDSHPILHNQNIALLGIVHSLERIQDDLNLLHSKLQPILKMIGDDQAEWQKKVRG